MLSYPFRQRLDTNGAYLLTFPDIPEAVTSAHTEASVMRMAGDALESALEFYFEDGRAVPMPSAPKRGQRNVTLSASMSGKVLLLNEMIAQQVRPADLARRLKTTPQAVNRLTTLRHSTKIDGLVEAFAALGKKLELRVA